jgi:hypothetical protein
MRRRVEPRATTGGARGTTRHHRWGAWEDAPPLFMLFQKGFPALLWSFEGLFCIFQII